MEHRDYVTLAGLVIEELGHLPVPGERLDPHGWCFEVIDLDGRRIDKLLASRPDGAEAAPRPTAASRRGLTPRRGRPHHGA